jgi:hypothetical protein
VLRGWPTLENSRHWAHDVAVFALVGVLSVFFVPAGHGPYSAVYGPVTALRSVRNKLQLVLAMELASLRRIARGLLPSFAGPPQVHPADLLLVQIVPPELSAVLRC